MAMTTAFGVHPQAPQKDAALNIQSVIKVRGGNPLYVARESPDGGTPEDLARHFTLYEDPNGHTPLCTVAPRTAGAGRDGDLAVTAPDGALLAVLRPPVRSGGRARYETELPDGTRLVGRRGTTGAWVLYVVLSPLVLVYSVASLIGGYGIDWHLPSRTAWRASGGPGVGRVPLKFYGINDTYKIRSLRLDARVAYAQAVLHFWTS